MDYSLNAYPPAVIYADEATIDNWLNQVKPNFYDYSAREDFKYTVELLNESQKTLYTENGELPQRRTFCKARFF